MRVALIAIAVLVIFVVMPILTGKALRRMARDYERKC